jgi:3-dehydroquinate synthase
MIRLSVEASKDYEVLISGGLLKDAGKLAAGTVMPCKALIVTDDMVDPLYCDEVEKSFGDAGFGVCRYVFTHGERSKNMHTLSAILEFAADNHLTRSDILVALGGGITGDIAGMAAAVYLRGVEYIQIPTTFLAAIDSSVGGKTAVNLAAGKNLAGAFWQPCLVICDTETFSTLPAEVFADGTAEAVKYGMISDPDMFETLESGSLKNDLERTILRCINIKRKIVFQDEYDRGDRQILNFGHTFGHAIEKCSGYSISHGHAVAIGMAMMAKAAEKLGISRENSYDRLVKTLERYGLSAKCDIGADDIFAAVLGDKKRSGGMITVVVPIRIGKCQLQPIPVEELKKFILSGLGQGGAR